jgi:predicted nucleic acid-binding protein
LSLFDTDVLIDILRETPGAREAMLKYGGRRNLISAITFGEVLFGMREHEKNATLAFLSGFQVIGVDTATVELAYDVKRKAKGHNLELYDCVIAATGIIENQALITRNRKHYPDARLRVITPEY